ncbi:MAG: bacillithiol biosynthesis deacetylase BshB1 [Bacteroidota bacterium]|nr:bacillithiol biosynthesis deacetylase BshB1 [Bacteroidota bacterium]
MPYSPPNDAALDVLAFSPHPDDAELYCGGTLLALKRAGFRTGIADVTGGELGTLGSPETRLAGSEAASAVLSLDARVRLGIPDCDTGNTRVNRLAVIRALRALRPTTILVPPADERHPDHGRTSVLVHEAAFESGLEKIVTEVDGVPQAPHRPLRMYAYAMTWDMQVPPLLVDVSDFFERKMEAVRCYASQFPVAGQENAARTSISSPAFIEALIARARYLGFLIGVRYAEGFFPLQPFAVPAEMLCTP